MKILDKYALSVVLPVYLIGLLFFVLALQLVEIVTNLIRYIQLSVPIGDIIKIQFYFLPSSIHFALPIAMLFAVSFSMGTLHSNNELQAVFGIGSSLFRFSLPIIIFAACISIGTFFLEDSVVIRANRRYAELRETTLLTNTTLDNQQIAIFGPDGRDIYYADYYDDAQQSLENVIIIERDVFGKITRRINAKRALWKDSHWQLQETNSYTWDETTLGVTHLALGTVNAYNFTTNPDRFQRAVLKIEEMSIKDAKQYLIARFESGLPYRKELTSFYRRYSFSLTPLIIAIIACGIGGLLKRNTLLLSMILSLCVTVLYYIVNLMSELLAINGYIPPVLAAWGITIIFIFCGLYTLINFVRS